jgi:hypothetical protein
MRKIAAEKNYEGLDIYSDLLDIAIGHSESEEVDHLTSLREIERWLKILIKEADGALEEEGRADYIANLNRHQHGVHRSPYIEENIEFIKMQEALEEYHQETGKKLT